MTTENQNIAGAAEGDNVAPPASTTPAATTPAPAAPKVEVKDGAIFVNDKKMVAEHDLMALKQSSESAAEKAQAAHTEAIDASKLELSEAQQALADVNAKLKTAQEAQGQGATTDVEVAGIKQERDDAKKLVETLTVDAGKALDFKRALLVLQYSIPAESLADKTMQQLDSFEEAAKALATSRGGGPGPYAIGAGGGGAAPITQQERAAKILEVTPVGGTRTADTLK